MKHVKSLIQKVSRGEGGFTLIELLIVVGILAVIAAVVVLNVGGFLGSGTEESANTEAHQVQTAVVAYMAENNLTTWNGTIGPSTSNGPEEYLLNPTRLQAIYGVTDAKLDDTTAPLADGKWANCTFADGAWACP